MLSHAIEKHRSMSSVKSEDVRLLLECALKMPEKLFAKAEKLRFLKWLEGMDTQSHTNGEDTALRLCVVDIERDGGLVLAYEDGSLYEKVRVSPESSILTLMTQALDGPANEVVCWINAAGELVKWQVLTM